jgi:hypothetical protein
VPIAEMQVKAQIARPGLHLARTQPTERDQDRPRYMMNHLIGSRWMLFRGALTTDDGK